MKIKHRVLILVHLLFLNFPKAGSFVFHLRQFSYSKFFERFELSLTLRKVVVPILLISDKSMLETLRSVRSKIWIPLNHLVDHIDGFWWSLRDSISQQLHDLV